MQLVATSCLRYSAGEHPEVEQNLSCWDYGAASVSTFLECYLFALKSNSNNKTTRTQGEKIHTQNP